MKRTEIDALLADNPQTVFRYEGWQKGYARIVAQAGKGYRIDLLTTYQGSVSAGTKPHVYIEHGYYKAVLPQQILCAITLPEGVTTLEELAERTRQSLLESFSNLTRKAEEEHALREKVRDLTGLPYYELKDTPITVVNALYDALTRDKVGA
jgi:hypothetical protein